MIEHVHFKVSGKVQGVGFRQATQAAALHLGLRGWVRNLADGRVEGVAEGASAALQALRSWLQRGPQAAAVSALEWTRAPPHAMTLAGDEPFGILPSAPAALD